MWAKTPLQGMDEPSRRGERRPAISRMLLLLVFLCAATGIARAADPSLIAAARYEDAAAVRQLLSDGVDPNTRQADGATALHWAVYRQDLDMLAALLEAGADVNSVNRLGASPLFIAAESGHAGMMQSLLAANANPNLTLQMGETPLMTAARSGSTTGVLALLAAGADVNAHENSRGQTALMWAAVQGHVEVARALLNAGADLEARSMVRSRLMFADATNGNAFDQGVMEQLGGFSPLLFAAQLGDVAMGRLLLGAEANIEGVAGNGVSPLVVAIHSGHTPFAQLLLEKGADANAIGAGYNALHAAVLRGDLAGVTSLLEHGADPNVRLQKANPVQRASEDWTFRTAHIGATPFWLAASFREAEIMRALAQAGADPLMSNEELWDRPRDRADRDSWTAVVVGGFESALQAAIRGSSSRDRYYVIAEADPVGEELLALAAVKVAVELGVNLNHTDFTKSTALHDAASRNLGTIVRELAMQGADINALNSRGQTPLDLAFAAESRTSFFGFDLSVSGPTARAVLEELGAMRSK